MASKLARTTPLGLSGSGPPFQAAKTTNASEAVRLKRCGTYRA